MDRLFFKNEPVQESGPKPQEHFLKAQQAWNEVYGRAVSGMRNWRNISFALVVVLLVAIAGLTWQGTQSKIVPYVVVLDKEGRELYSGLAAKSATTEEKVIKKELENFIKKVRLASVDRQLMLQNINFVYAHLRTNTSALKKLNSHFQENNPFELISKETRIVDQVNTILPVTDNTWSVEWTETTRNVSNADVLETKNYKAIITVSKQDPETQEQWNLNPFGIWVIDFQWEQKI